jgi:hypothetical protein
MVQGHYGEINHPKGRGFRYRRNGDTRITKEAWEIINAQEIGVETEF